MEQEILSKSDRVQLKNYEELFQLNENNLRRIYIVGDVGSGKSAFCKKLLCDWCKAVRMPTIENVTMNQFAFLFYIPLRKVQGITTIREMIFAYYKNEASREVLEDILLNWPDKCLIIIDGLDEWIPTLDDSPREHMTLGLPDSDDLKLATIITTSRPSAPGILNMISSDSDLKVYLKGIDKSSTELMAKKYMAKIRVVSKKCVGIESVLNKLNCNHMKQIESTPLLLLQIVWLMCWDMEIGDSMSEIYSSFVNIALKWAERRTPDPQMLQVQTGNQTRTDSATTSCHTNQSKLQRDIAKCSFNHMVLPKQLEKYCIRKFYCNIIFSLSKIAFEILTQQKKTHEEFGRQKLIELGIDDQLLNQVLNSGIVTEENSLNPMYEKTHFAFTHTSYLEYFVALHLASHKEAENITPITTNEGQLTPYKSIFARLIGTSQSIQDAIKLDNILVIACGLNNNIIQDICEYIYRISNQNGHYLDELSMHSSPFLIQAFHPFSVAFEKLQNVVIRCMLECRYYESLGDPRIPMYYVVLTEEDINKNINAIMQQRVDPERVFHIFILYNDKFIFETIQHFSNIQTISIRFCKLSQSVLSDLCSYISSTKSLRSIQMHYVTCCPETRMRHIIDLSEHQYLQVLRITRSKVFPFKYNKESSRAIEHCTVDNTEVINWLSHSRTLRTLQVHFVRLTRELCAEIQTSTQLQELQLWVLKIDDGVLNILPHMQQLKYIILFRVTMSATTWCSFVDSLGKLEQSVTVERFWLVNPTETQTEEWDYVKKRPKTFHVLNDENYPFKFYTLK